MPTQEKILLKDQFFNEEKVRYLGLLIKKAYFSFDDKNFIREIMSEFPDLELKQRISFITISINKYLPNDYETSLAILLKSLPRELNPNNTDDDFGDFIFAPLGDYVSVYGCKKEYLEISLNALEEMTKRFSCEDAIRNFINNFEEESFAKILNWSKSDNYHVRRLSSEGTRPLLPWSKRVNLDSTKAMQILDNLYFDNTRYVTRSVANHLNDISKIDSELVVSTLKRWKNLNLKADINLANNNDIDFITKHSLRTLVKKGDSSALKLLGFSSNPKIEVNNFEIKYNSLSLGDSLEFSFKIISKEKTKQSLIIDYNIYFTKANGKLSPKTYKISKKTLAGGESLVISKKHPLKEMTTLKLYTGKHSVELQINGASFGKKEFDFSN